MPRFLLSVILKQRTSLLLALLLSFVCTACSLGWGDTVTPPKQVQKVSIPTTPPAKIYLGAQPCPDTVQAFGAWRSSIALAPGQNVEHVLCGDLLGIPALQAVLTVRHTGSDGMLDVFVYTDIENGHPREIFRLKGLMHGDAKISGYNTLLTAQEDPNSFYNTAQKGQWTVDLYHEYKWSDAAHSLVQVPFAGIFPDLTRYQAEVEQVTVNNGRYYQQWRLSALQTAQHFAVKLLKWPSDAPATVVSGGGPNDIHASVQIQEPGSSQITVLLDRLERNPNGGIWEVIDVQDSGLALTPAKNAQPLTSPTTINGNGKASAGTVGTIDILDHLYSESGQANVWSSNTTGPVTFSKPVPYTVSFKGGTQEGVIVLSISNTSNNMLAGIVLMKVLLSA